MPETPPQPVTFTVTRAQLIDAIHGVNPLALSATCSLADAILSQLTPAADAREAAQAWLRTGLRASAAEYRSRTIKAPTDADGADVATTYYTGIFEHELADENAAFITAARSDVPRLLALADAVLKLAHGWEAEAGRLDAMAEDADSARSTHLLVRAQGCADSAAALLAVITTGLLGEDSTDGTAS